MKRVMTKIWLSITAVAVIALCGVSFSVSAQASDIKDWQIKIVKLVAKKQVYPRAAMRKELEGRAKVRVNIDRSGAIVSHEIITPTGESIFDEEIPKLMERINPLPSPPDSLGDDQLSFVLPLSWVIR